MRKLVFNFNNKFNITMKYVFSKRFLIDKFLVISLFLSIQVNDLLVRGMTVGVELSLKPFLSNILIVLLSMFFVIFVPKKLQSKTIWFFIGFSTFLAMANYSYFSYFGRFLTLGQLQQTGQLGDVKDSILQVLSFKLIFFLIVPVACYIIYKKIYYKTDLSPIHSRKGGFIGIVLAIVFTLLVNLTLLTRADLSRIYKLWNRDLVVSTFGIYTYQFSDAYKIVSNKYFTDIESEQEAIEVFESFYTPEQMQFVPNDLSGIFQGRDVYYIHYESAQRFLVNQTLNGQEVLPTFNRLSSQGIYFNNIQSQESYGTSSDTEFTVSTSLLPLVDGTVFVTDANKSFISTERLLNDSGYEVLAFHANKSSFWNRNIMLPNLGYDKVIGREHVEYPDDVLVGPYGVDDIPFYEKTVEYLVEQKTNHPDTPVFAKIITLTNHHSFEFGSSLSDLDLGDFDSVSEEMYNYIRSYNYADKALDTFFVKMEENGLLDNAVVVIYGDHNAPLPADVYDLYANYDFENNVKIEEDDPRYITLDGLATRDYKGVPLLIWTKDAVLGSQTNNVVGGLIDVGPTVNNLLGIHNPYQLGDNLFYPKDDLITYVNGSWKNSQSFYSSSRDKVYGAEVDPALLKTNSDFAILLSSISRYAIFYNMQNLENEYIIIPTD